MMKKILVAAAAMTIAAGASAAYKDGTYTGEGKGRESTIQVSVTVKGGKVSAMKVLKHGETPMLIEAAEKKLGKKLVKGTAPEALKPVSGASLSSAGIIEAVKKALAQAK